ncbi:MAG: DNA polymerase III, alpha subunit, partial [uncultured bacterium]
ESVALARQQGGPFQSFYDFCARVDLRRVTKKVLEVLIKSGAFDVFAMPRRGMFESLEKIVTAAVKKQKDESQGQSNLFASFDAEEQTPVGLDIAVGSDWTRKEALGFEKEVFGFYFSGHPLEVYQDNLHKLATHNSTQIAKTAPGAEVTLGGVVSSIRTVITKNNDKMAFVVFDDLLGSLEAIAFPRTYKKYHELLASEQPLIIAGKVDRSEQTGKIIIEDVVLLSEKLKQTTRSVHLHIPIDQLTPETVKRTMTILSEHKGESRIYFHLLKRDQYEAVLELPPEFRALACEPLQYHLNQLFDDKIVRFM